MRGPSRLLWLAHPALVATAFVAGVAVAPPIMAPTAAAPVVTAPEAPPIASALVALPTDGEPAPEEEVLMSYAPLAAPDRRGSESAALRALRADRDAPARPNAKVTIDDLDPLLDAPAASGPGAFRGRHRALPTTPLADQANPHVLRFVRYFSEDPQGRATFATWLRRSGAYAEIVSKTLREHGLPRDLVAVAFVESGLSPNAVSSAGATGLWQFMPQTARAYGLTVEASYDERRSPWRATEAAASHLADLFERYHAWDLALAAYNLGYAQLERAMGGEREDDFWRLSDIEGAIPRETAQYVPKVIAVAMILRDLAAFGFDDVEPLDPVEASPLEVPPGTSLALVARAAGTSVQRIRELNPEVRGSTVVARGNVVLHVVSGGLARAQAMLPRLLAERDADGGDDLETRDAIDDVPTSRLARTNARNAIDASPPSVADAGGAACIVPRSVRPALPPMPAPAPKKRASDHPRAASEETLRTVYYRVAAGDTLASVAATFGLTPLDVLWQNGRDDLTLPPAGTLLRFEVAPSKLPKTAARHAGSVGTPHTPGHAGRKKK